MQRRLGCLQARLQQGAYVGCGVCLGHAQGQARDGVEVIWLGLHRGFERRSRGRKIVELQTCVTKCNGLSSREVADMMLKAQQRLAHLCGRLCAHRCGQ
jgi:hypothetical protein